MTRKVAVVTGCNGQDGSYLAELLLNEGYKVVGMIRRASTGNTDNIAHIFKDLEIVSGDLSDGNSISNIIQRYKPDEFYNLGAMSFVPTSWETPEYTADINALGPLRILEAIKRINSTTKFYQAATSEMFGQVLEIPQKETTPFYPKSPYGVSKCFAFNITRNYRESYKMFASNGILFNHESPRRGLEFVTRKITNGVARIKYGFDKELRLGNLNSKRDWGFAGDYVKAMHKILQHPMADDFVIGSEETHTIREFCEFAFGYVGLLYEDYVVSDPAFYRPAEVEILLSDCTKAHKKLGWHKEVDFQHLVEMMVENDLKLVYNSIPSL